VAVVTVVALIGAGVHKGLGWFEFAGLFGIAAVTASTVAAGVVGGALGYTTCHPAGLGLDPNPTRATYQCHSVLWGTQTERRPFKPGFFEDLVSFQEENAAAGAFYFGLAAAAASLLAALAKSLYRKTRGPAGTPQIAAKPGPEP
jgi:hypothetical protein